MTGNEIGCPLLPMRCISASMRKKRDRGPACHLPVLLVPEACGIGLSLAEPLTGLPEKPSPQVGQDGDLCACFPLTRLSLGPDSLRWLNSSPPWPCLKSYWAAWTVENSEYKPYIYRIPGWPGTPASLAHTSYPTDLAYMLFRGPCQRILSFPFPETAHPGTRKQLCTSFPEREWESAPLLREMDNFPGARAGPGYQWYLCPCKGVPDSALQSLLGWERSLIPTWNKEQASASLHEVSRCTEIITGWEDFRG